MAALRLSTGPGMGMAMKLSARAMRSAERPAPSLPIMTAQGPTRLASVAGMGLRVSVGPEPGATAARRLILRDLSRRISAGVTATTGTRKTDPAEARRAFWFQGLTVPAVVRTPVAPKASAERMRVPRLPGSWSAAAMSRSEAVARLCGERVFEGPGGGNEERGDALRGLRVGDAGEEFGGELDEFDAAR